LSRARTIEMLFRTIRTSVRCSRFHQSLLWDGQIKRKRKIKRFKSLTRRRTRGNNNLRRHSKEKASLSCTREFISLKSRRCREDRQRMSDYRLISHTDSCENTQEEDEVFLPMISREERNELRDRYSLQDSIARDITRFPTQNPRR